MPHVRLESARTSKSDPGAAADELLSQLEGKAPKLLTLFASSDRDQRALNAAVRARVPASVRLIGATSAGEIDRRGMHQGSVVHGAISGDVDIGVGVGRGLADDAISAGVAAVAQASSELGVRPGDLSPRRHVGLVIDDASRMKKEELLLGMLEKNQSLLLVGGGASDLEFDPMKQRPLIHVDGEVLDDAALVVLFATEAPFAALRAHWYEPTGQTLRITRVDETHTRALEIDGKPAALRYAELIGVSVEDLDFRKPNGFAARPTALKVGREYFIRGAGLALPDHSLVFANLIEEGAELEIMKMGDIVGATQRFFQQEIPRHVASPTAAFLFQCSARNWIIRGADKVAEVSAAIHAGPPCVGLNVSFEIYCGFQINTTLTALVFGEKA